MKENLTRTDNKNILHSLFQETVKHFNTFKLSEQAHFTYNDYGIFEKWFFRIVNTGGQQLSLFSVCIREVKPDHFILEDVNDEHTFTDVDKLKEKMFLLLEDRQRIFTQNNKIRKE